MPSYIPIEIEITKNGFRKIRFHFGKVFVKYLQSGDNPINIFVPSMRTLSKITELGYFRLTQLKQTIRQIQTKYAPFVAPNCFVITEMFMVI